MPEVMTELELAQAAAMTREFDDADHRDDWIEGYRDALIAVRTWCALVPAMSGFEKAETLIKGANIALDESRVQKMRDFANYSGELVLGPKDWPEAEELVRREPARFHLSEPMGLRSDARRLTVKYNV